MARFVRIWLFALLAAAASVIGLAVAVDPYGILATPRTALTARKTAAANWPRMTKPYLLGAAAPATILLGSSNVDIGMNPRSNAWPAASHPVFNLGINGASPELQLRFLRDALDRTQPKTVLIGISLEDAMETAPPLAPAAPVDDEARLRFAIDGRRNPDVGMAQLKDLVFATFSLRALKDSLLTLLQQGDSDDTSQTALGLNNGGNFARWTRSEGANALVAGKDADIARLLLGWARSPGFDIQPVMEMVELVRRSGARAVVFMVPKYVDYPEMLRQLGLTERAEDWKAALLRGLDQATAGGEPVPLWDFTAISRYTTETLPPAGDLSAPLQWFWEPVHFRPQLGDLMIERMSGGGDDEFGRRLTTASLPAMNAADRQRQRDWAAAHAREVERLAAVLARAGRPP